MGVIYKLKAEVVNFIIERKKENPDISCRKLVAIIKDQFQLDVSKSSINAIIKTVNLSSPVGRRTKANKISAKFKIPDQRRLDILKAPSPAASIVEDNAQFPISKVVESTTVLDNFGVCLDGLGSFFLKAAEWEVSGSSLLGNLLKDYKNVDHISDLLIYLKIFDADRLSDIHRGDKLKSWKLRSSHQRISQQEIVEFIKKIDEQQGLSAELLNLSTQMFSEINYFKLLLEDGTSLHIDARFNTIWSGNDIPSGLSMPLNKASSILSSSFIVNVKPAIINSVPGKNDLENQFYDFVCAFENIKGKKITSIGMHDQNKAELLNFSFIPDTKRTFLIGVWPWQNEDSLLARGDVLKSENFYSTALSLEVTCSESMLIWKGSLKDISVNLRMITLVDALEKRPILSVLTNILSDRMSNQEIINTYLGKWPNLHLNNLDFLSNSEQKFIDMEIKEPSDDLWSWIDFLIVLFHKYCQRHFFPLSYEQLDFSAIKDRIYSLGGRLVETADTLEVVFPVKRGWNFTDDLSYAIRRINESEIRDPSGRQMRMKIFLSV